MNKIERWLVNRGYKLDQLLCDTRNYTVKNLKKAATAIKKAVKEHRKIYVLADYDVDGVMSGCILYTALTEMGADFIMRFPKKMSEGYGLSDKILPEIPDNALLITIDNGIAAVEAIEEVKKRGIDTIVLDHHIIRGDGLIPEAEILVDPHVVKEDGDFEDYCGAGLGYKLVKELGLSETTQKKANVLAAIATIQDIVPLVDDNRNIVREGLRVLNAKEVDIPGIYGLLDALNRKTSTSLRAALQELDIAFQVGPCINAMGRIYDDGAQKVFEYLMHYETYGMDGIQEIIRCNQERKALTSQQQGVLDDLAKEILNKKKRTTCLVVYAPDLHEGIIGINAAKLVETYNMPAIVLTDSEDGRLKGSARSTPDIHMKNVLDKVAEYIYAYGGHAGAAGLTVEKESLKDFIENINKVCPKSAASKSAWQYDMEATEAEIPTLYDEMRKYAPYGEGFPMPVFKVNDYQLKEKYGKKYRFVGENGVAFNGNVDAVSFTIKDKYRQMAAPSHMNLIATLGWSSYSNAVQMNISDFQPLVEKVEDGYLI